MGVSAPGVAARQAALTALTAVLDDEKPLDVAWRTAKLFALDPRDAGFARLLVLTALRRLGSLDAVIDRFVQKRPVRRNMLAIHIIRLAAAELLVLKGAAHAAVDSAVRLAKAHPDSKRLSGMVNAVCRRITREGMEFFNAIEPGKTDTPAWLWMRLVHDYGEDTAQAIAAAHRAGAPLDFSAKAGDWAERLNARVLPNGSLRLGNAGSVEALEGYGEGAWWAQDAAAALPVAMLGDVTGKRVLDLCAAPGGKTMQLAAAGAQVTALDLSEMRAKRLHENLARTGLAAEVIVADALEWEPDMPFDAVLLDAPCSATGTIRRHPDLPYLKSGKELTALVPLQDALLDRAFGWLAEGGMLVYAVCSLLPAEGHKRVAAFLERTPEAALVPLTQGDGIGENMIVEGALRTLPCHWAEEGGMDGFYAARVTRR